MAQALALQGLDIYVMKLRKWLVVD